MSRHPLLHMQFYFEFKVAIFVLILLAVGFYYRDWRSWVGVLLTGMAVVIAPIDSILNTGVMDQSKDLYLEKLTYPYTILLFGIGHVTEDSTANAIRFWCPAIQALLYGIGGIVAYKNKKFLIYVMLVLLLHGILAYTAFLFHPSDLL